MENHRKGFFDTNTAMIFDSGPGSSPAIFLTFIKQKEDGSWEKPSKKEGRTIKFSLVDIAFILQVLRGEKNAWKTVHSFQEREISISFERDPENRENLKVKVGDYLKLLNYGETEVYKALLEHTFQEKVITSTEVRKRVEFSELKEGTDKTIAKETTEENKGSTLMETTVITGVCNGETEKALLIAIDGKKEIWVPKSTIRSSFDSKITGSQKYKIDTWILKKNNIR